MAKLVYSTNTSLDGYSTDANGDFRWAAPDEELMLFINEMERASGTYLLGRRMYETMLYWETAGGPDDDPIDIAFAEMWRATPKIVYSRTLAAVSGSNTRLEPVFDHDAVRQMKSTEEHDLSISGPTLAGDAIGAGLVDEMHLYVVPVNVGGGTPTYPKDVHSKLELLNLDRFASGAIHLHYRLIN